MSPDGTTMTPIEAFAYGASIERQQKRRIRVAPCDFKQFQAMADSLGYQTYQNKEYVGDNVYTMMYTQQHSKNYTSYFKCDNIHMWLAEGN